jgi:hypothetical protein
MSITYYKNITLTLIVAFLISCSTTKLAYNYADFLVLNWFESYVDLNESQRLDFKKKVENFFTWHRKFELPKVILFLEDIKSRYKGGLKKEDISWISDRSKTFWDRTLNHIEEDLATFLFTIRDSQVLQAKVAMLENEDDWLIKQSKMTSDELHSYVLSRLYVFLEDWMGNLEVHQKKQIAAWVKTDPNWILIKLRNREKFQNDLIDLLKHKHSLKDNIYSWVRSPSSHWTHEYKKNIEDKKKEWEKITFKIDSNSLPRQRKHIIIKLDELIEDFRDIAGIEGKTFKEKRVEK